MQNLTGNKLKIIAATSMFADHLGAEVFGHLLILRIIGRLAFPIFAYLIYEGCRYTHNKLLYVAKLCGLGLFCFAAFYLYNRQIYVNVLLTFTLSACSVFAIQLIKRKFLLNSENAGKRFFGILLILSVIFTVYLLCRFIPFDYGFWGAMLPILAELFNVEDLGLEYKKIPPIVAFFVGLVLLSLQMHWVQPYCLLSIILIAFYNGQRGKYKMKHFFYVFYPTHFLAVEAIAMFIRFFK